MANYNCWVRTNYFHVKDEEAFQILMEKVQPANGEIEVWKETDQAGKPVFGFGCSGGILGIPDRDPEDDDCEYDYVAFLKGLQECVKEDDAVILMESGHEKLNYLSGNALVLTKDQTASLDIITLAQEMAAELLGKPEYSTQCDY